MSVIQYAGFSTPFFREPRESPTGKQHDSALPEPWVAPWFCPSSNGERERDEDRPSRSGKQHDKCDFTNTFPITSDDSIERPQEGMIVILHLPQAQLDWARDGQVEPPWIPSALDHGQAGFRGFRSNTGSHVDGASAG